MINCFFYNFSLEIVYFHDDALVFRVDGVQEGILQLHFWISQDMIRHALQLEFGILQYKVTNIFLLQVRIYFKHFIRPLKFCFNPLCDIT